MHAIVIRQHLRAWAWALAGSALFCVTASFPAQSRSSFTLFESGQVRPLALSPDGSHLFAVNTPDNRLEIFRVRKHGLQHIDSVPVGLEPVAVAVRSNTEVWVVNHLSDSVSVVNVHPPRARRVMQTLLVGDEPRDIVFAGPRHQRAFITTAHRGQNAGRRGRSTDPNAELTTPGVGRADVWVFDADHLGTSLGGDPLTVLTLFTDTPRALAATPDGTLVYAAGFQTGNQTTSINEFLVKTAMLTAPDPCTGLDRRYPGPRSNYAGILQPEVGLIVKFDGSHWRDERGQCWDDQVPFALSDTDVFTIDALARPVPKLVANGAFRGVGTILFNMIVNPVSGYVYVGNTEAQNQTRFEGTGAFSGGRTVRGHLHESRITVLGRAARVEPRHLNKHIDFSQCCAPIPNEENATSVAFPQGMAITGDGATLYVAAFGTSEIAVYNTQELENDTFVPSTAHQIPVSGGGPSGVVLDEAHDRLYVLTRFDNAISIIDTASRTEVGHVAMFNPEPKHIVEGRPLLYDAAFTSSHGDSACASCHVFGDFDSLAWDLGDPGEDQTDNSGPFRVGEGIGFFLLRAIDFATGRLVENPVNQHFRPMKGPMTTQSLRGLDNHGSMHWRGDRTGGNDAILGNVVTDNVQPNGGSFDEDLAFRKFNVAFLGLNGRHAFIPAEAMQQFTDFALEITYPPNPIRNLNNALTPQQQAGRDLFFGGRSDSFFNCNGCHVLDRDGNRHFAEVQQPGFFGTDGQFSFEGESQLFKIPHLRNLYQKVGMFGMPPPPGPPFVSEELVEQIAPLGSLLFLPFANDGFLGDQVRGFGFLHDGSVDTVFRFISTDLFTPRPPGTIPILDPRTPPALLVDGKDPGNVGLPLPPNDPITPRRNVEAFLLAFDSNLAPIVGQQVTLTRQNAAEVGPRIDLLIARAEADECDLVAKNRWGGVLYVGAGTFQFARQGIPPIPDPVLRATTHLPQGELTYTCVPPGSGRRIGLDRDGDGIFDGDDHDTRRGSTPR
jgi:DNA-binding beta-propeller fold protein YncE